MIAIVEKKNYCFSLFLLSPLCSVCFLLLFTLFSFYFFSQILFNLQEGGEETLVKYCAKNWTFFLLFLLCFFLFPSLLLGVKLFALFFLLGFFIFCVLFFFHKCLVKIIVLSGGCVRKDENVYFFLQTFQFFLIFTLFLSYFFFCFHAVFFSCFSSSCLHLFFFRLIQIFILLSLFFLRIGFLVMLRF